MCRVPQGVRREVWSGAARHRARSTCTGHAVRTSARARHEPHENIRLVISGVVRLGRSRRAAQHRNSPANGAWVVRHALRSPQKQRKQVGALGSRKMGSFPGTKLDNKCPGRLRCEQVGSVQWLWRWMQRHCRPKHQGSSTLLAPDLEGSRLDRPMPCTQRRRLARAGRGLQTCRGSPVALPPGPRSPSHQGRVPGVAVDMHAATQSGHCVRALLGRRRGCTGARPPTWGRRVQQHRVQCVAASTHAVAIDLDGVVHRGKDLVPSARASIKRLQDSSTPFVFLTNGGGCLESEKAEALSRLLDLRIDETQVQLAHTPMRQLALPTSAGGGGLADKLVVVVGKSRAPSIAHAYGFRNTMTMEELHSRHPHLFPDMVPDPWLGQNEQSLPDAGGDVGAGSMHEPIAAVLVFMDPHFWHRELQLLCDVLRSRGVPDAAHHDPGARFQQHVAIYLSCPDFEYVTEAKVPRFGAGAFGIVLGHLFELATGHKLETTWYGKPLSSTYHFASASLEAQAHSLGHDGVHRVYAIGDNPKSDIAGASQFGWSSILVRTGMFRGPGDNDSEFPADVVLDDIGAAVAHIESSEH